MNKIFATVSKIQNSDILNVVNFQFKQNQMTMISLEVGNLHVKDSVILTVKPSSVAIGKNFSGEISYSNQLKGKIKAINHGALLCSLEVDVDGTIIESIITNKSALKMNLSLNDEVTCIVKASNLSILKVLS